MDCLPEAFFNFISPDCDRLNFIQNFLNENSIESAVLKQGENNHIYVKFPKEQYNPVFKIKTVIAHYDRVPQSPGANDNSAAVWSLLEWAVRLRNSAGFHNVRLIFTDGEEKAENGVASQGAFTLAENFKKLGITNDDVFVFDCMGRGDVPVINQNDYSKRVSDSFIKKQQTLEDKAEKIIKKAADGRWFRLSAGYSDNAGFIANGIPSVAITMLPSSEVSDCLAGKKPLTWSLLHTPDDSVQNLTPVSFEITARILDGIARLNSL